MLSDGNQYVNYFDNMVYFDTVNGLIKLKEGLCRGKSGILRKESVNGKSMVCSIGNYRAYFNLNVAYPFREPIVGDTIYATDSNNNKILNFSAIITSITKHATTVDITTDTDLGNYYTYCYTSTSDIDDLVTYTTDNRISVKFLPSSEYTADIYLDLAQVVGFSYI